MNTAKLMFIFLLWGIVFVHAAPNLIVSMPNQTSYIDPIVCNINYTNPPNLTQNITVRFYNSSNASLQTTYIVTAPVVFNVQLIPFQGVGQTVFCNASTLIGTVVSVGNTTVYDPYNSFYTMGTIPDLIDSFLFGFKDLFIAIFSLGILYMLNLGITNTALSYGVICLVLFFILSNPLFIYIGVICIISGMILKYSGI